MKCKFLTVIFLLAFMGCTTVGNIKNVPLESGTEQIFDAKIEDVLQYAKDSSVESGLKMQEFNQLSPEMWMIVADKGLEYGYGVSSYGAVVRLVVKKINDSKTSVRVYSKKRSSAELFTKGDYTHSILSSIDFKIKMKQSVKAT